MNQQSPPTNGTHSAAALADELWPRRVGHELLFVARRRDGQQFTVSLDPHLHGAQFVAQVMDIFWSLDPGLARALLDHLILTAPQQDSNHDASSEPR